MRFFALILPMLAILGCDHPHEMHEHYTTHPANVDAPITPPIAQTDTLKVTYSKTDSYKPQTTPKTPSRDGKSGEHEGHREVPPSAPEKKPDHSEHPKK